MDDIAQDPASSTPAERVARGRSIWHRYSADYASAAPEDAIADLLHFADTTEIPGGAETVLERAQMHYTAERP